MTNTNHLVSRAAALGALALVGLASPAIAQVNIVQDPGFESAVTTGSHADYSAPNFIGDGVWQVTSGVVTIYNDSGAFSGRHYLSFVTTSANALSQTLPTLPGATYDLSFYARSFPDPNNTFSVTFDGKTVPGIPSILPGSGTPLYINYTASNLSVSGSAAVLTFNGSTNDEMDLDQVSVTLHTTGGSAVPEPGSVALLFGMAGVGVGLLRKRRK